jgi:hypothetical protein
LTRRANTLATMKIKLQDSMRAFDSLKRVPELFRRFLSQYLANAFEGVDRAIDTCRQSVYTEEGFAGRWDKMLPADRLILQWIAQGQDDLHGAKSLARIGSVLRLGRPADRSVPQNALKRLRERQILIQSDIGVYRFEDEAFKDWVTLTMNGESSKSTL